MVMDEVRGDGESRVELSVLLVSSREVGETEELKEAEVEAEVEAEAPAAEAPAAADTEEAAKEERSCEGMQQGCPLTSAGPPCGKIECRLVP